MSSSAQVAPRSNPLPGNLLATFLKSEKAIAPLLATLFLLKVCSFGCRRFRHRRQRRRQWQIVPAGPLLSWARLAIHDVHVGPNLVPAGTTAIVNMWSITHDGKIWTDSEKFRPDRFIDGEDVSIMGSDLRLAPFGSGRRVCPGKAMGLATVHLWVGQMIQNFEWVKGSSDVDLAEVLKLSMEMKKPLKCKTVPRNVCFG